MARTANPDRKFVTWEVATGKGDMPAGFTPEKRSTPNPADKDNASARIVYYTAECSTADAADEIMADLDGATRVAMVNRHLDSLAKAIRLGGEKAQVTDAVGALLAAGNDPEKRKAALRALGIEI